MLGCCSPINCAFVASECWCVWKRYIHCVHKKTPTPFYFPNNSVKKLTDFNDFWYVKSWENVTSIALIVYLPGGGRFLWTQCSSLQQLKPCYASADRHRRHYAARLSGVRICLWVSVWAGLRVNCFTIFSWMKESILMKLITVQHDTSDIEKVTGSKVKVTQRWP